MTGRNRGSDAPCVNYSDAEQRTCGATPTDLYIQGPRCARHTPSAERGLPEPPKGKCAPARCHCGDPSCHAFETYGRDSYTENGLAWAAVDARAVASGKRRASPSEQAAAKAAVQEQKDRAAALRHPDRPEPPERVDIVYVDNDPLSSAVTAQPTAGVVGGRSAARDGTGRAPAKPLARPRYVVDVDNGAPSRAGVNTTPG